MAKEGLLANSRSRRRHAFTEGLLGGSFRASSAYIQTAWFKLVCRSCLKQDRHNTGRLWVGRNGTVVSCPHTEQFVRVSARTLEPPPRFNLHALQRLGSL